MKRMTIMLTVGVGAILILTQGSAWANLISNGSFEAPVYTSSPWYGTDIDDWGPAWQTSAGAAHINTGSVSSVPDGDQWAWIMGSECNGGPGFISTAIDVSGLPTLDDVDIPVSFWLGASNNDGGSRSMRVQLMGHVGDAWPELDYEIVDGPTTIDTWGSHIVTLNTGTGYAGTELYLSFKWQSGDTLTTVMTLDDVVVIPEPMTMTLLACTGASLLLRRQRSNRR